MECDGSSSWTLDPRFYLVKVVLIRVRIRSEQNKGEERVMVREKETLDGVDRNVEYLNIFAQHRDHKHIVYPDGYSIHTDMDSSKQLT